MAAWILLGGHSVNDNATNRLDRASTTLANSVWMLTIPLILGLVSCGMGINAYVKVPAAEKTIEEVLTAEERAIERALAASPPIHLLDDGQCSAHSFGDDAVCAASWWIPSEEEGRYNPAGLMETLMVLEDSESELLEIYEDSQSEFLILGGLPLLLILLVIQKIRKTRRILDLPDQS